MKKKILYGALGLTAIALIYLFAFQKKDSAEPVDNTPAINKAVVVRPMRPKRGDLDISVSATGVVTPINVVEIKCKAGGLIVTLNFEESDKIPEGKVMVTVDSTDTRNAFAQAVADSEVALAALAQQGNNLKRAQELLEKNLISQQDYDLARVNYVQAKSNLTKAQANLVSARQKLADTVVRSPITGVVLARNVSQGQIIASAVSNVGGGTTIAQVADMRDVYVTAAVDEVDIGKVAIGERAKIVADAYPGDTFYGRVLRIASQATVVQNVTTFNVVIEVPNYEFKLKAGMNTTITIQIAHRDNVVLIPNDLLRDLAEARTSLKTLQAAGVETNYFSGSRKEGDSLKVRPAGERSMKFSKMKKTESDPNAGKQESDSTVTRFVVALEDGKKSLKPIKVGLMDADNAEVISGLTDTTTVYYVKVSEAKKDSDQFKQMLKGRSGLGISR